MQLTHERKLERNLAADSARVSRNDFERGYEDDETFERPDLRSRHERRLAHARLLAQCRATRLDEDDLDDIAADFGDR